MYPNNLILTRPVLLNPKQKWGSMGKVVAKTSIEASSAKTDGSKPHEELL